ncbi:MAG: DUF349 domain-containing protein [Reichenbachiella sp.]
MSEEKNLAGKDEESLKPDAVQVTPELTTEETNTPVETPLVEPEATLDAVEPAPEAVEESTKETTIEAPAAIEEEIKEVVVENATPEVAELVVTSPEPAENPEVSVVETTTEPEASTDTEDNEEENHEELHEDEHEEEIDYTTLDKAQLLEAISTLSKEDNGYRKGKAIASIKSSYDTIFQTEKETALNKFIEDGGEKDDFEYKLDEISTNFDAYHKLIRDRRVQNGKELEKQKENNLELKNDLLVRLRELVDNDESTSSIKDLKVLQEEWRTIGPVHPQHNKTLWANYNALLDLYYDHRSIYFELKELDKKKNLEKKQVLCGQAETLDSLENLNEAIKKLNEFHEEYKHIGPVPKDHQEETWLRFKSASDKVYAKRKEYFNKLKESFTDNYEKKITLSDNIQEYLTFNSEKIGEWNKKTKDLLAIQKEWETIGSMPKEKAKDVNKKFWGAFKGFFRNKSLFFKTLDSQREENLTQKKDLVAKAVELSQSDDWDNTANKLKALQTAWKEVGPVPEKQRESIYQEFKVACDDFFNKKRGHNKEVESSYDGNLSQKEEICAQLDTLGNEDALDTDKIFELQDQFGNIGFVPKNAIKKIQAKYQEALDKVMKKATETLSHDQVEALKSTMFIHKLKSDPHAEQKIYRKEINLKRKIQHLENDVSTWKNNIGFFANSKSANQMVKDFEIKITAAETQLTDLKEELKFLSQIE